MIYVHGASSGEGSDSIITIGVGKAKLLLPFAMVYWNDTNDLVYDLRSQNTLLEFCHLRVHSYFTVCPRCWARQLCQKSESI